MRADRVMPFYDDVVLKSSTNEVPSVDNVGGVVQEVLDEVDIRLNASEFVENWIVLMQDGRILPVFHYDQEDRSARPVYYIASWTFNNW